MKTANDYPTDKNFALLLIGVPKSGKTTLSLAFPKLAVLDCDRNLAGPMRYSGRKDFLYDDPSEVPEEKRWEYAVRFVQECCKRDEVETILIDGLSHLAEYLIKAILASTKLDTARSRGGGQLVVGGEEVMQMAYWGPFRNKMVQLVSVGRSSGKRFIITCHEAGIQNDNGAVIAYRPMIPGQLKDNLAGMFSDVWRTEISSLGNQSKYTVRFAPRNLHQIGNSLNIPKAELDITGKLPSQVWTEIGKYF